MFPDNMFTQAYFPTQIFPPGGDIEDPPIPPLAPSAGKGGLKGVINRVIGGRLAKVGRGGF